MSKLFDNHSDKIYAITIWIIALAGTIYYIGAGINDLAPFAFGVAKAAIIFALWDGFDRLKFRGIDTIQELKNGNIAYAVGLLAAAILIYSCFGNI